MQASGRYTFRAWFGDSSGASGREEVIGVLRDTHSEFEWYSKNLLAIDALNDEAAQQTADLLHERQLLGQLTYETGRLR